MKAHLDVKNSTKKRRFSQSQPREPDCQHFGLFVQKLVYAQTVKYIFNSLLQNHHNIAFAYGIFHSFTSIVPPSALWRFPSAGTTVCGLQNWAQLGCVYLGAVSIYL